LRQSKVSSISHVAIMWHGAVGPAKHVRMCRTT
jgi:hypothetical protein